MSSKDMPLATRQGASHPAPVASASDLLRATTEEMACFASVDMDLWNRHSNACLDLANSHAALVKALDSIRQYGSDTLSGRVDGPDDRAWQRGAVLEMTRRAIAALALATKET